MCKFRSNSRGGDKNKESWEWCVFDDFIRGIISYMNILWMKPLQCATRVPFVQAVLELVI